MNFASPTIQFRKAHRGWPTTRAQPHMRIQQPQTRSGHNRRCRRPFTISRRPNANNWNIVDRPSSHSPDSAESPLPKNSKPERMNLPTLDDHIRSEPCAVSSLAGSKVGEIASHYLPKPTSAAGEIRRDRIVSSNDSRSSGKQIRHKIRLPPFLVPGPVSLNRRAVEPPPWHKKRGQAMSTWAMCRAGFTTNTNSHFFFAGAPRLGTLGRAGACSTPFGIKGSQTRCDKEVEPIR